MSQQPEPAKHDDSATGLPWPRSWRGVYAVVLGCFAAYLALLTWLGHTFQ